MFLKASNRRASFFFFFVFFVFFFFSVIFQNSSEVTHHKSKALRGECLLAKEAVPLVIGSNKHVSFTVYFTIIYRSLQFAITARRAMSVRARWLCCGLPGELQPLDTHRYVIEARCALHERPFLGQHKSDVYRSNYPSFWLACCGRLED